MAFERITAGAVFVALTLAYPASAAPAPKPASYAETHVIDDVAHSLSEVAILKYGHARMWRAIAKWNDIKKPFRVHPGQKLVLKLKPTVSDQRGRALLVHWWKRKLTKVEANPVQLKQAATRARRAAFEKEVRAQEIVQQAVEAKVDPNTETPSTAEGLFRLGEQQLKNQQYNDALANFQKSRNLDPDFLPPWLFTIRTLKTLKRHKDEASVTRAFLERHPRFKNLPMFKKTP